MSEGESTHLEQTQEAQNATLQEETLEVAEALHADRNENDEQVVFDQELAQNKESDPVQEEVQEGVKHDPDLPPVSEDRKVENPQTALSVKHNENAPEKINEQEEPKVIGEDNEGEDHPSSGVGIEASEKNNEQEDPKDDEQEEIREAPGAKLPVDSVHDTYKNNANGEEIAEKPVQHNIGEPEAGEDNEGEDHPGSEVGITQDTDATFNEEGSGNLATGLKVEQRQADTVASENADEQEETLKKSTSGDEFYSENTYDTSQINVDNEEETAEKPVQENALGFEAGEHNESDDYSVNIEITQDTADTFNEEGNENLVAELKVEQRQTDIVASEDTDEQEEIPKPASPDAEFYPEYTYETSQNNVEDEEEIVVEPIQDNTVGTEVGEDNDGQGHPDSENESTQETKATFKEESETEKGPNLPFFITEQWQKLLNYPKCETQPLHVQLEPNSSTIENYQELCSKLETELDMSTLPPINFDGYEDMVRYAHEWEQQYAVCKKTLEFLGSEMRIAIPKESVKEYVLDQVSKSTSYCNDLMKLMQCVVIETFDTKDKKLMRAARFFQLVLRNFAAQYTEHTSSILEGFANTVLECQNKCSALADIAENAQSKACHDSSDYSLVSLLSEQMEATQFLLSEKDIIISEVIENMVELKKVATGEQQSMLDIFKNSEEEHNKQAMLLCENKLDKITSSLNQAHDNALNACEERIKDLEILLFNTEEEKQKQIGDLMKQHTEEIKTMAEEFADKLAVQQQEKENLVLKKQQRIKDMQRAIVEEKLRLDNEIHEKCLVVDQAVKNMQVLTDMLNEEQKKFQEFKKEQQNKQKLFEEDIASLREFQDVFERKMDNETKARIQACDRAEELKQQLHIAKKEIQDLTVRLSIEKKKNLHKRTGMQKTEKADKFAKSILKSPPIVKTQSDMVRNYKGLEDQLVVINEKYAELLEEKNHLSRSLKAFENQTRKQQLANQTTIERLESELQRESEKMALLKQKMKQQQEEVVDIQRDKRQLEINLRSAEDRARADRAVLESLRASTLDVSLKPNEMSSLHSSTHTDGLQ